MRILHSLPSVDLSTGGPIQGVLSSAPILREMGHEVEIVSLDAGDEAFVRDCPVKVHAMGDGKGGYGSSPRFVPWLREHHSEYDRVVVDGLWQYHGVGVEQALRGTSTPYYVFSHGMLDPWFRRRYPLKHVKKQVFWLASQYRVLKNAQALLFTCEEERIQARNAFFPYGFREKVVSYFTARPEKSAEEYLSAFRAEFPEHTDRSFLLFLSRIHEKKGIDLLVRAFGTLKSRLPYDLVIAGPDPSGLGAKLQEECRSLGIADRVHWVGMVRGDAKYGAFYAAEASILPSHQENFGVTVAESLACATPTLISNKVNIWREIADDRAGIVSNDDIEGAQKLLLDWQGMSDEEKSEMGANALKCFDGRFEIRASVRRYLDAIA
jgi:glycosyltransferase involved in cell wall biosynthesis